jgi:cytochrome o ubiquinol oxidase subunit II
MQEFLSHLTLLNPQGVVALAERGLMIQATFFMLIVAVPVFALIFFFAYWYRASNTKAKYTPDWAHSNMEELVWWAIPLEIVLVLGALTWSSTHELDPRRPLSNEKPLQVQVVALPDKWLFVYPEENIATVNYLAIPEDIPVRFSITADAPMNSFWIPSLGGQIYAMTGMVTELNLLSSSTGKFVGRSANYSGPGFAKMKFITEVMPQDAFQTWVLTTRAGVELLDQQRYVQLKTEEGSEPLFFSDVDQHLFNDIVRKFMNGSQTSEPSH